MWRNNEYAKKFHDTIFKLIYGQPKKLIQREFNGPIIWPVYQRVQEKEKIKHFISYEQNIVKQQINSKNMLFVVGPKGVGKSWFIKNSCKNTIIVDNNYINFDSFFNQFKESIINYICQHNLITIDEIINVITQKYLPNYLDIYYNQYLRDQLTQQERDKLQTNSINQFQTQLDWDEEQLEFWKEDALEIKNTSFYSHSFINSFKQLCQNRLQESLYLLLQIIQQIEIEKIENPIKITNSIGYIQQMDILFDLLNYISGFQQNSSKKHDIALILLNTDKIFEYYRYDNQAIDFFDHLILRTYNDTGIRNHFPIIIESSNSKFYNRDMIEMMNIELNTVLHLDILDLKIDQIKVQVEGIFTQDEIQSIYDIIGGSIQDWHQITKDAVTKDDFQIESWLNLNQQKQENQFKYLMNNVVINNEISEQLDNNTVDANIFRFIKAFKYFNGIMFTGTYYADVVLMENSIIHALQQENVIYHPKYISHIFFTKFIYNKFLNSYITLKKKQIKFWPEEQEDSDLLVSAFRLTIKERGEYLKQFSYEPRKYIYDDLRKEERPYHESYI